MYTVFSSSSNFSIGMSRLPLHRLERGLLFAEVRVLTVILDEAYDARNFDGSNLPLYNWLAVIDQFKIEDDVYFSFVQLIAGEEVDRTM